MNGLFLKWTCAKCGNEVHNHIGITNLYKVNGEKEFARLKCDSCGQEHYVSTKDENNVVLPEHAKVKETGICCF